MQGRAETPARTRLRNITWKSVKRMKISIAFFIALLLIQTAFAQQPVTKTRPAIPSQVIWRFADLSAGGRNHDPDKAQIITTDIDNFWRAYDLAAKETTLAKKTEIYQREYLD